MLARLQPARRLDNKMAGLKPSAHETAVLQRAGPEAATGGAGGGRLEELLAVPGRVTALQRCPEPRAGIRSHRGREAGGWESDGGGQQRGGQCPGTSVTSEVTRDPLGPSGTL